MKSKRIFFAALFSAGMVFTGIANAGYGEILSLTGKKIAFYLDSGSGSFYLENPDPADKRLHEMLFKDMPPTSYITLYLNGKPYHFTDKEFKVVQEFQYGNNTISGVFQWGSNIIRLTFLITNLHPRELEYDSVAAVVTVKNQDRSAFQTGARFLYDTVYGESIRKPAVYLSTREKIEYDRLFNPTSMPEFVFSGIPDPDNPGFGTGLFLYPFLNELRPESLVIGNWKKLNRDEQNYTLEPLARFRFNNYSNPDAAAAFIYKNISVKSGEEVSFGTIMSVYRLSIGSIKVVDAVIQERKYNALYPQPQAAISAETALPVPSAPGGDLSMLQAQLKLLEKATQILDRLELAIPSNRNLYGDSSIKKGLENSVSRSRYGDPFDQSRKEESEIGYSERPEKPERDLIEVRTNNRPQPQVIVTNIQSGFSGASLEEMANLQKEIYRVQAQYEKKIAELQDYYENQLKQQDKEFRELSSDYKEKSEEREKRKARFQKMEKIDTTMITLDKNIDIVEQLMGLKLDFESMPPEKMKEMEDIIRRIDLSVK